VATWERRPIARGRRAEQLLENAEGQWKKAEDPSVSEPERTRAATRAAKSEALAAELDPPNDDGDPPSATVADDLPKHRVPSDPDGVPDPHAQRNFTDADSRIMVAGGTYVQAYHAQVSVDDTAQVIVALAVTNQPPDVEHFVPMLDRIEGGLGRLPQRVSGDSGYYSNANVQHFAARGIDAYIAVGRTPHGASVAALPRASSPTKMQMRAKLESPEGHAIYARRKVIVEPVFGQIKSALGFRRFSLRGLAKVRCEWALVCLAHNLLKLFRFTRSRLLPA
jgi:hypothetical protein